MKDCSLDDGDVARLLTRTVDLLRQVGAAAALRCYSSLITVLQCIKAFPALPALRRPHVLGGADALLRSVLAL